jgi:hypothetical protein
MAVEISNYMRTNSGGNFILVGHSAGADAVIIVMDMIKNETAVNVDGVILLDPTLTASIPGTTDTSISSKANQIHNQASLFLGDTNEPSVGYVHIAGSDRREYDYDHYALAVVDGVADDAFASIGR